MTYRNKILAQVPQEEIEVVSPGLREVKLELKKVLYEPFETIEHVYFVTNGVVSMVNEPDTGEIVEVATVGLEGMVGFPVLLGSSSLPTRTIVQIRGEGLRMSVADLTRALPRTPRLHKLLLRQTMCILNQIAQGTSCNRVHEVQERCARWLLQITIGWKATPFP